MKNRPKLSELAYMLGVYSNKTIPQTYIMEMSNYELLLALLDKINEVIERCNIYTDAINEIDEILNEIDEYIKEEVEEILNKMYEDGEFNQIIAEFLSTQIASRTGDLDLSLMGWTIKNAHSYCRSTLPTVEQQEASSYTYDEEFYNYPQGNCVFKINGNIFWAVACIPNNGSHFDNANMARIYVYTVNQDGTLSYVDDYEYADLGHCNHMTFLNGSLYITPQSYRVYDAIEQVYKSVYTTDLHKITFDGSSLGHSVLTVSLDYTQFEHEDEFYDRVCSYNGELYVLDAMCNMFKVIFSEGLPTTNVEETEFRNINGEGVGYSGMIDGFSITDDYIYYGANNYRIKRYNKQTKVVDWTFQLPVLANNKQYKIGEIEGFTIIDNVLYLLGGYNMSAFAPKINQFTMMRFFRQNIVTNEINPTNTIGWNNSSLTRTVNLYVNGNLPNDTDNPKNINGRSLDSAFSCVQEAIDFVESNFWIERANIVINQYRNTAPIDVVTTKPIKLSGTNFMNNNSTFTGSGSSRYITNYVRASVGHINIREGCNVQINDIAINNILPVAIDDDNVLNSCIHALNSNVAIEHLYFPTGQQTNQKRCLYALNIGRSQCELVINMTASLDSDITGMKDTAFFAWNTYRASSLNGVVTPTELASIDYANTYNTSVNTHGALRYYEDSNGNYYNDYVVNVNDNLVVRTHKPNFVN